jgi:hypothetical protein
MTVTNARFGSDFVFDKLGNIITTGDSGESVVMIKMNADGIITE